MIVFILLTDKCPSYSHMKKILVHFQLKYFALFVSNQLIQVKCIATQSTALA